VDGADGLPPGGRVETVLAWGNGRPGRKTEYGAVRGMKAVRRGINWGGTEMSQQTLSVRVRHFHTNVVGLA
jgi:hypothetical protein